MAEQASGPGRSIVVGDLLLALVPYGLAAAAAAPAAAVVAALVLGQAQRPLVSSAAFISGALLLAIADVGAGDEVIGVIWLLARMLLPYYVPVIMYMIAPERSLTMLRSFSGWLLDHSRIAEIVTGVGLGTLFLWKGIAALA
jgi:hypothetical protein